jgi:hypothetical protein
VGIAGGEVGLTAGDTSPCRQERESAAKKRNSGCGAGRVSAVRRRRRPPWSRSSRRHREGFLQRKGSLSEEDKAGMGTHTRYPHSLTDR